MTECEKFRRPLEDYALGIAPSTELELHLARCGACVDSLAELRRRVALIDAAVRPALAVEPPATLRSRVFARIQSAPARRTPSQARRADLWSAFYAKVWQVGAAACVLAAGLALFYTDRKAMQTRSHEQAIVSTGAAIAHWRSPTDILLKSTVAPSKHPTRPAERGGKDAS